MHASNLYLVGLLLPIVAIILLLIIKSIAARLLHRRFRIINWILPFFLISIHLLTQEKWQFSMLPYALIVLCLIGILLVIYFALARGEIIYRTYFRFFWRLSGLIAGIWYIGLAIITFS